MYLKSIAFAIGLSFSLLVAGQDCSFYYPQLSGASLTYQHFDKKEKSTGKSVHEVSEYHSSGNSASAVIKLKNYDKDDKLVSDSELEVKCENQVFYFDMKNYLDPETLSAYQEMEMTMNTSGLEVPSNVKVGDELKDGTLKIKISTGGFPILTITMDITDRKVLAKEDITTPAGSFSCYKLSQTVSIRAGLKMSFNSIEWLSEGTGVVRSESYNSKGALTGKTELIAIQK